jgi:hypothetical protein
VILDIFAQNAHTQEGRAQVELAILRYRLPRMRRGAEASMSQQSGGIGTRTRGKGETKLEVDRRAIQRRIDHLVNDLAEMSRTRSLQRKGRDRSGLVNVTIVGYTNAGKSSLLNRLTDAGVLAEDRLFATLDPTTRRLSLPGGEPVLLTDTVGFVRRLPHGLVESFKSTLEVATSADFLVHVVDASAPDPEGQIKAVHAVLEEIDRAGAEIRYCRLVSALARLADLAVGPRGARVAAFLAGDAVALARMAAALDVVGAAATIVDPVGGPAAHLRRAIHWRHYAQGPVSALHRGCGTDISRGALRLWLQAGGVAEAMP